MPRGTGGWPPDEADPRRQSAPGTGPVAGRGWDAGPGTGGGPGTGQDRGGRDNRGRAPRFIPDRAQRRTGQAARRASARHAAARAGRPHGTDGYDRRGLPDDFTELGRGQKNEFQASSAEAAQDVLAVDGFDGLRSGAPLRWLGTMSTLTAALVLAGATVTGVVVSLIAGLEPGNLLGFFVIVGSLAAVLGVRRGAVYLLFPMPALAFFAGAVVTGIIHDRELAASTAGLGAGFAQWVAGIFFPAVVATILVLLVGGTRWLLKSPLVTGTSSLSGGRLVPRDARSSRDFRRPVDSWGDDRFLDDGAPRSRTGPAPRQQTGPTPRQGTGPTPRQPTGPTPQQGTGADSRQARQGPTPRQGTGPTPRQGTGADSAAGNRPDPRQGTGPTPAREPGRLRGGVRPDPPPGNRSAPSAGWWHPVARRPERLPSRACAP